MIVLGSTSTDCYDNTIREGNLDWGTYGVLSDKVTLKLSNHLQRKGKEYFSR